MEQLIVVATFAVCAAACVKILTASYFMATDARDTGFAIRAAESSAECYKALSGDIGKTAEIIGGSSVSIDGASAVVVYYDEDWRVCGENNAEYILRLVNGKTTAGGSAPLLSADLSVSRLDGEEILAFAVAARGDKG